MPDASEIEPLHLAALREVVAKLKAHPAVSALVPEQVFGPDELAHAGEWSRCVIVTAGMRHGPLAGPALLLVQRDARAEMRAESREMVDRLAVACVKALSGAVGKQVVRSVIHTHSEPTVEGPGYFTRTDKFGCHCKRPPASEIPPEPPAPVAAVPPPKRLTVEGESNG